jgi:hypothetical protein
MISRTLPALARQAAFDYAKKLGAAIAQVKAEQNVRSQAKDSYKAKVEQGEFTEKLSEWEGRLPF